MVVARWLALAGWLAACGSQTALPGGARRASTGSELAVLYDTASQRANQGDREGALAALGELDAVGWSFCPADRDMPGLTELPRYRALCARMKQRAPVVQRATVAFTLADPELAPEGIAYDDAHRALFVGSMAERKIVRIAADGSQRDFATREVGLDSVLGLRVDAAHGLLWAVSDALSNMPGYSERDAGRAGLFAFDLETGALRARIAAPPGPSHLLNDVAIGPDGSAYVTDTSSGAVDVVRRGETALAAWLPAGTLRYPNGVACDGERVFVAHQTSVAVIGLADGQRRDLAAPPGTTLGSFDGLYVAGDSLFGVQNGFGSTRVVRIDLDAAHQTVLRATVLESGHPALADATTAALVTAERKLLVIAGGDHRPSTILAVPIE
jgi:sugar lactone lactonase YvrE